MHSNKLSKNTLKQIDRLHEKQVEALQYSTFEQMHVLWLQYIFMLLAAPVNKEVDLLDCSKQTDFCGKLVKADFSGGKVTVIKSKNT